MKNTWYKTKLTKAILVLLSILCSVTIVVSILWFVAYPVLREELLDGKRAKEYEDTLSFDQKMQEYNYQVTLGLSQNVIFTTDRSLFIVFSDINDLIWIILSFGLENDILA